MAGRDKLVNYCKSVGYNLADDSLGSVFPLDLIIGVDNMYKFMYATNIQDNIYSVHSKIGTLLMGTFIGPPAAESNVCTTLHIGVESKDISIQEECQICGNLKPWASRNQIRLTGACPLKNLNQVYLFLTANILQICPGSQRRLSCLLIRQWPIGVCIRFGLAYVKTLKS